MFRNKQDNLFSLYADHEENNDGVLSRLLWELLWDSEWLLYNQFVICAKILAKLWDPYIKLIHFYVWYYGYFVYFLVLYLVAIVCPRVRLHRFNIFSSCLHVFVLHRQACGLLAWSCPTPSVPPPLCLDTHTHYIDQHFSDDYIWTMQQTWAELLT